MKISKTLIILLITFISNSLFSCQKDKEIFEVVDKLATDLNKYFIIIPSPDKAGTAYIMSLPNFKSLFFSIKESYSHLTIAKNIISRFFEAKSQLIIDSKKEYPYNITKQILLKILEDILIEQEIFFMKCTCTII